jgi:hypothetical protein
MFLDALLMLSGSVSATTGVLTGQAANGAGSILSTNTIDAGSLALGGNQAGDLGRGENLYVEFSILTAPTVGTTVQFQIIQADDAALTSNVQVINQTDAIPIASLTAGSIVPLRWDPTEPYTAKRYIGARYVNVGAIATFSVVATVVKDVQSIKGRYNTSGYAIL